MQALLAELTRITDKVKTVVANPSSTAEDIELAERYLWAALQVVLHTYAEVRP